MDRLEQYRHKIEQILTNYYQMTIDKVSNAADSEVSDRLAFDRIRDQYLWFRFGWKNTQKVQHIIMYLRIKNDKIWVEEDATDLCIVDDLLAAGIPKHDIILGFHHPKKRPLTEFATA
jgi:XisI protein